MSVMREELHHLIDQLPEEQVAPILALVRESLPVGEDGETLWPLPSFVGTSASGKGDVAARSQEILPEEMARGAHRVASWVSGKSPVDFGCIRDQPRAFRSDENTVGATKLVEHGGRNHEHAASTRR